MTWRSLLAMVAFLLLAATAPLAQVPDPVSPSVPVDSLFRELPDSARVALLDGRDAADLDSSAPDSSVWFVGGAPIATFRSTPTASAVRRVEATRQALERMQGSGDPLLPVQAFEIAGHWSVLVGGSPLLVVAPADTQAAGLPPDSLAMSWAANLEHALLEPEREEARHVLRRTFGWGLLYPIAYVIALVLTYRALAGVRRRLHREARRLTVGRLRWLSPDYERRMLVFIARATWVVQFLALVALTYALAVGLLSLFPETRHAGAWLGEGLEIAGRSSRRALAFVLPRLIILAILVTLLRGAFRLVDSTLVAARRRRGRFSLRRDQARVVAFSAKVGIILLATLFAATLLPESEGRIVTLLVVLAFLVALVLAWPVLLNLGYRLYFGFVRPFEVHDHLTTGSVQGTVVGIDLFGVRVATQRGKSIFVPYGMLSRELGVRSRDSLQVDYRVRIIGRPEITPRMLQESLTRAVTATADARQLKAALRIIRLTPDRLDACLALKLHLRHLGPSDAKRNPETDPVRGSDLEREDTLRMVAARRAALEALQGEFVVELSDALRAEGHEFVIVVMDRSR